MPINKKKKYSRRSWTEHEDNYLLKKYLTQSVGVTAKRLNRSVSSVKHRAARLGLNHYMDNISAKVVSQCFNVDFAVVKRWIEKYGLPVDRVKDSSRYSIDPVLFWKWAESNRNIINWSRYEIGSLPPEPGWVKEECKNYKASNSRKRISKLEIEKVRRMWIQGYSYDKIATEIKRSVYSVKHILRKMAA